MTSMVVQWADSLDRSGQLASLLTLARARWQSRCRRLSDRLQSPRQATLAALLFGSLLLYLLAGVTVLSRREPSDPRQLKLWLSGGMVLYAIYHGIKQLWSNSREDQDDPIHRSPADALWLGGGPISRRAMVLREAFAVIPATLAKTGLLLVVLQRDAESPLRLAAGVLLSLLALELIRRVTSLVLRSLQPRENRLAKSISLIVLAGMLAQIGLDVWTRTPAGSDPVEFVLSGMVAVGDLAASPGIQAIALPLQPAAHLAIGQPMPIPAVAGWHGSDAWAIPRSLLWLVAFAVPVALGALLISIDSWVTLRRNEYERELLHRRDREEFSAVGRKQQVRRRGLAANDFWLDRLILHLPLSWTGAVGLFGRQAHCLRRYASHVLLSFAIPTVLSLSPLLTNQQFKGWVFVIGGITLSSLLLAPPALQIDFRRDLKRMELLRGLPIGPAAMCFGMLGLPVLVTAIFQWTTLTVASCFVEVSWVQYTWLAIVFPALATFTFAVENALFLMFPHHVHEQGITMVLRAKVTFLWKGFVLAGVPTCLALWGLVCVRWLPGSWIVPVQFTGGCLAVWMLAGASVYFLVTCWKRFDPQLDTPAL